MAARIVHLVFAASTAILSFGVVNAPLYDHQHPHVPDEDHLSSPVSIVNLVGIGASLQLGLDGLAVCLWRGRSAPTHVVAVEAVCAGASVGALLAALVARDPDTPWSDVALGVLVVSAFVTSAGAVARSV